MKIITKDGRTRNENIQDIIIKDTDKYGVATIAYFKNSLSGQNVEGLSVKSANSVQLYHNRINGTYTLRILKFRIAKESIINNYRNFKLKYDVLIKDKISQLNA